MDDQGDEDSADGTVDEDDTIDIRDKKQITDKFYLENPEYQDMDIED